MTTLGYHVIILCYDMLCFSFEVFMSVGVLDLDMSTSNFDYCTSSL